ncbi:MAG TPA: hypothetical protein VL654_12390 [Casimicrobiaceae bacterium]|jgi:hypothetical protein|nr:hypothetical protein [Casimicrobiaceae bacterium]
MNCKSNVWYIRSIVGVALALGASAAFADDSSMSVLTGDSYAYFNHLDNHPGGFNTARATAAKPDRDTAMKTPQTVPQIVEKPTLLAQRPSITATNPFSDDKGA